MNIVMVLLTPSRQIQVASAARRMGAGLRTLLVEAGVIWSLALVVAFLETALR